jgi:hypothetical protein
MLIEVEQDLGREAGEEAGPAPHTPEAGLGVKHVLTSAILAGSA